MQLNFTEYLAIKLENHTKLENLNVVIVVQNNTFRNTLAESLGLFDKDFDLVFSSSYRLYVVNNSRTVHTKT